MHRFLLPLLGVVVCLGCETPATPPRADIPGAQFISFRCVQEGAENTTVGLPLEGCGCSEIVDGALRRLGRVECTCRQLDPLSGLESSVARVRSRCTATPGSGRCPQWSCEPVRGEDGDWIPADGSADDVELVGDLPADCSPPAPAACEPQRDGQVRAYVGSAQRGEVAVLDVTAGDPSDRGREPKRVLDVDRTIPGITSIFVDDLVTDILSHPEGHFVFTVNSSSGTLSVIRDDFRIREAFKLDLGVGPLFEGVVWPSASRPVAALGGPARAFISAPTAGLVVGVDLQALGALGPGASDLPEGVVVGEYRLPGDARPGRVAVHPDGSELYVAHARVPRVTVFDVESAAVLGEIDLAPVRACDDGYLVRVVDPADDQTCTDGLDNDGNGLIDEEDPACAGDAPSEAANPRCPKVSECADGVDNDGDGLIDGEDPDCDPEGDPCVGDVCPPLSTFLDWEGPVPACANGVDDDGDGLVDRADPGCTTEADDNEADPVEAPPFCEDGEDNDGDGLIDAEDPGCIDADAARRYRFEGLPACADGVDNDRDGRIDFGGDAPDPDCYAASDRNEGGSGVAVGPTGLATASVREEGALRTFLYVVDAAGPLVRVDVSDPARPLQRLLSRPTVESMAVRQPADDVASLLIIGDDGLLRSIEITAPVPALTDDGRLVYGRMRRLDTEEVRRIACARVRVSGGQESAACTALLAGLDEREVEAEAALTVEDTFVVEAFYTVEDGVAWAVTAPELTPFLEDPTRFVVGGRFELPLADATISFTLPADPGERTPLPVIDSPAQTSELDRGALDRLVFVEGARRVLHQEANVRTTALGRTNRVDRTPQLTVGGAGSRLDPARHPVFCRLPQPGEETPPAGCVAVGFTATGTPEPATDARARTRFRVDTYEGIQVVEDDPARVLPGVYTLTFEGELPRSPSRSGQFGGQADEDAWTLLDYEADFCDVGVEAGDVLLVDRFVPLDAEAAASPECARFQPEAVTVDPFVLREPLRYRVEAVTQHKLELVREPRETYEPMLPPADRGTLPRPFEAPPAPPFKCAAQLITYRVRVANEQWILTGDRSGYRHPWVARDGMCTVDRARLDAGRFSRTRLGQRFENEWFRFRLGAFQTAECTGPDQCAEGLSCINNFCVDAPCTEDAECPDGTTCDAADGRCEQSPIPQPVSTQGVPPGRLPYLLDARYTFEVVTGAFFERLPEVSVLPREMEWLPNDDRLYIVDGAIETVIEVGGLNVYDERMTFIRRFR